MLEATKPDHLRFEKRMRKTDHCKLMVASDSICPTNLPSSRFALVSLSLGTHTPHPAFRRSYKQIHFACALSRGTSDRIDWPDKCNITAGDESKCAQCHPCDFSCINFYIHIPVFVLPELATMDVVNSLISL